MLYIYFCPLKQQSIVRLKISVCVSKEGRLAYYYTCNFFRSKGQYSIYLDVTVSLKSQIQGQRWKLGLKFSYITLLAKCVRQLNFGYRILVEFWCAFDATCTRNLLLKYVFFNTIKLSYPSLMIKLCRVTNGHN